MTELSFEDSGDRASFWDELRRRTRQRPYPVLGLALITGYVAGGGLFSPWTRPLARGALGALLVPGFREQLRDLVTEPARAPGPGTA